MFLVYLIRNIVNGKIYVGWTGNTFNFRWSGHCYNAVVLNGRERFAYAIRKYKPESFIHEILAIVATEKEAKKLETLWIITLRSYGSDYGYNMTYGGEGTRGFHHYEETKKHWSEIRKGCTQHENTRKATRINLKNLHNNPEFCRKKRQGSQSPAKRQKARASMIKRCSDPLYIKWLSEVTIFKDKEFIEKRRKMFLGRPSPLRGTHNTEEANEKNRQAHLLLGTKPPSPKGLIWITDGKLN